MNNLAIIPARGGSKRIPQKNIKDFLGKPIIAYPIEIALNSDLFDEIMVSTDNEEIAKIAEKYGAKVPFMRSVENSNDTAVLSEVVEEVKRFYLKNGKIFDYICCIFPTAPLINRNVLKQGLEFLINKNGDSCSPLIRFSYPIQRAVKLIDDKVIMFHPEHKNTCSQDLEKAYHDAGQFYWMKFSKGLKGENKLGFEIDEIEAQDIDNQNDWLLAELKYKIKK